MLAAKVLPAALIPWLLCLRATGFSTGPSTLSRRPPSRRHVGRRRRHDGEPTVFALRQGPRSVNDDGSGFHYDQEPRGTSYISQVSQRDLWERRQMRRPGEWRGRRARPETNSRGVYAPRQYFGGGNANGGFAGGGGGEGFEAFRDSVSANLDAMTDLLRAMRESQSGHSADVQALTQKVADIADRLGRAETKGEIADRNPAGRSPAGGMKSRSFGTSLDGEFHKKIKDVVDAFGAVDREGGGGGGGATGPQNEEYYRGKITQLEAKINRIDEALKETERRVDGQMEFVDRMVSPAFGGMDDRGFEGGRALGGMDDAGFDGGAPLPPPIPPPPLEGVTPLPPPPARPQEAYNKDAPTMDDGRAYFQERNFNDPRRAETAPPPREQGASRSVNTRSDSFHYRERNDSFVSAFSKADNDRRREFDPYNRGDPRKNQVGIGERPASAAVLSRGVGAPRNRWLELAPPPSAEGPAVPGLYPEGPGPYFYGDSPMMEDGPMMEEEYFYDDMYEF